MGRHEKNSMHLRIMIVLDINSHLFYFFNDPLIAFSRDIRFTQNPCIN